MAALIRQARQLLDEGESVVMVTVAEAKGSTPREVGTRMLFTADRQWQTIGGGHLEWKAAKLARELIACTAPLVSERRIEHFPLGPALAQCCGGYVTLVFEHLGTRDLPWLEELAAVLQRGQSAQRRVGFGEAMDKDVHLDIEVTHAHSGLSEHESELGTWFIDHIAPPKMQIMLFGAGHVGKALVQILGGIHCQVTWVDERESEFPNELPHNVSTFITDFPEEAVELAKPETYFLVMTHRHDLDLQLCMRILDRNDFSYAGVIGSLTKKAKFEKRLQQRGFTEIQRQRLTCPIGIGGISRKEPMAIAVSIAAELLRLNEQQSSLSTPQTLTATLEPSY